MAIDIGISAKDRKSIANNLSKLLADNYSLYLKTHSFHWNVTGPMFNSLHIMFETQYNDLWQANDVIAERIRALDVFAPGSYTQFGKLTSIKEEPGAPEWRKWQSARRRPRNSGTHGARDDQGRRKGRRSLDRRSGHPTRRFTEKTAWMLRSLFR